MQRQIALGFAVAGLALGIAAGYAAATATAVFSTALGDPRHSNKEGTDRVVGDFSRLGGYELVAANCNGTSDAEKALKAEAGVIADLKEQKTKDVGLISLAEAKLLSRAIRVTDKTIGRSSQTDEESQRVANLLRDAGWINATENHLRQIIQELDNEQCRQIMLGGAQ